MDYIAASGDTTFSSNSGRQCLDIKVVDDNVSESLETFFVNIDTFVNSVVLKPGFTAVVIQDNDGDSENEWENEREREREWEREGRERERERGREREREKHRERKT